MIKVDKRIKKGTKVLLWGLKEWATVEDIYGGCSERNWIKVYEYIGSFQSIHIRKFSNKGN